MEVRRRLQARADHRRPRYDPDRAEHPFHVDVATYLNYAMFKSFAV